MRPSLATTASELTSTILPTRASSTRAVAMMRTKTGTPRHASAAAGDLGFNEILGLLVWAYEASSALKQLPKKSKLSWSDERVVQALGHPHATMDEFRESYARAVSMTWRERAQLASCRPRRIPRTCRRTTMATRRDATAPRRSSRSSPKTAALVERTVPYCRSSSRRTRRCPGMTRTRSLNGALVPGAKRWSPRTIVEEITPEFLWLPRGAERRGASVQNARNSLIQASRWTQTALGVSGLMPGVDVFHARGPKELEVILEEAPQYKGLASKV